MKKSSKKDVEIKIYPVGKQEAIEVKKFQALPGVQQAIESLSRFNNAQAQAMFKIGDSFLPKEQERMAKALEDAMEPLQKSMKILSENVNRQILKQIPRLQISLPEMPTVIHPRIARFVDSPSLALVQASEISTQAEENLDTAYKAYYKIHQGKNPRNDFPKILAKSGNLSELKEDRVYRKAGKLAAYADGSIRFDGKKIVMRNQIRNICLVFIDKAGEILSAEDICDILMINAKHSTVSKYISELHRILRFHFKKNVIFCQPSEGWCFNYEKRTR